MVAPPGGCRAIRKLPWRVRNVSRLGAQLGWTAAVCSDALVNKAVLLVRVKGIYAAKVRNVSRLGSQNERVVRLCYDVIVRTTLDIPDEAYYLAKAIARDQNRSLGRVVGDLILQLNKAVLLVRVKGIYAAKVRNVSRLGSQNERFVRLCYDVIVRTTRSEEHTSELQSLRHLV